MWPEFLASAWTKVRKRASASPRLALESYHLIAILHPPEVLHSVASVAFTLVSELKMRVSSGSVARELLRCCIDLLHELGTDRGALKIAGSLDL